MTSWPHTTTVIRTYARECEICEDANGEHVEGFTCHPRQGLEPFSGIMCASCKHDDFISFDHYGEYMFNRYGSDWSNVEHDAYEFREGR